MGFWLYLKCLPGFPKQLTMKKIIIFSFTLFLIGCSNNSTNSNDKTEAPSDFNRKTGSYETMDDFAAKVFELIIKDDYKSIADLMPDLTEYNSLLNNSTAKQEDKDREAKTLENKLKNNIESLKQSYTNFKEASEKSGVDWTQSTLDFTDFKHEKTNNIESADLTLNFKYKGVNYKIYIKNCYKLNDTWLMGNRISFNDSYNRYDYYDRY